jgi:hypothetical protein
MLMEHFHRPSQRPLNGPQPQLSSDYNLRSCLKIDCQPDQLGMFELCLTKTIPAI